jgi:hypothetical protein
MKKYFLNAIKEAIEQMKSKRFRIKHCYALALSLFLLLFKKLY